MTESTELCMKARVLVSQSQTDEALRLYNQVLEADPGHALAHADRGTLYAMLRQFPSAIDDLMRAATLGYNEPSLYTTIATVYSELKEFQKALEYFDKAIALNPNHPLIYYSRANTHQDLGDNAAAIADLEKCLEFGPDESMRALLTERLNALRRNKKP